MTDQDSSKHADFIARVVEAFEHLPLPPPPAARQTIARLEHAGDERPRATAPPVRRPRGLSRLTLRQRVAAGGIGLSTLLALLTLLVTLNSPGPQSAMARMAQQLREVKSYSYQVRGIATWQPDDGKPLTTWTETGTTYWHAPRAFHSELKIIKTEAATADRPQVEQLVEHFAEIFPADKAEGIFVDYKFKTFCRHPYEPTGSETYPLEMLRLIRENSGEITRELGTKPIGGIQARGYVLTPKNSREKQPLHPLEVWVDPDTDLPIEFSFTVKDPTRSTVWRATDFRWNAEEDPKLFEPTGPTGFDDITPPKSQKELDLIAAALTLYAQLSGGHYPRVRRFDSSAVHEEMLKLAGFDGPPQPTWQADPKYQQVEQAKTGLDLIARIIRNRYHALYDGTHVGPADKDKLLMWWRVSSPERYCLVYGDLRTEIVSVAAAEKLGLSEAYPDMTSDKSPDAE